MCLRIAVDRPDDVLAKGEHAGHEFAVVRNGMGYRCGYVRVSRGHPWFGKDAADDHGAIVHGGITFGEADVDCGKGPDDGWWLGFDCAHAGDAPDPALPARHGNPMSGFPAAALSLLGMGDFGGDGEVRDQPYVEAECRSLCEQAAAAAPA